MPESKPDPVLRLQGLVVRYPGSASATLDGLDLSLVAGERLALVGPSGCGKSTVARAVLQLLPAGSRCSGELRLQGQDPRALRRGALRRLRGEAVGLVFQDPMTRLNPLLSVGDHLSDTLAEHRPTWRRRQVRQRAEELLERVGITPDRYGNYPHEFSGGMRQRLAIALAMALRPALVIADEPTTSLDVAVAGQVMAELCQLCEEAGSALLLISHDLAMAGRWCRQIAVLDQGRLVEQAPAQQLLTAPQSALAKRLVGAARTREGSATPPAPTAAPLLLELEELRCWHPLPGLPWQRRWYRAVDGVSLQLREGEILGVVGASGCGKSTLCRALMGLTPVRGGNVRLRGQELGALRGRVRAAPRLASPWIRSGSGTAPRPPLDPDGVSGPVGLPQSAHERGRGGGRSTPDPRAGQARRRPHPGPRGAGGRGADAGGSVRAAPAPPALRRTAAAGGDRPRPGAGAARAALR